MYCSLGNKVYKLHFDFLVSLLFTMPGVLMCRENLPFWSFADSVTEPFSLEHPSETCFCETLFILYQFCYLCKKILLTWGFFFVFQSCCQGADCFWLLKSKLPENGLFKLKSISHEHGRFSSHLTCLCYLVTQLLCDGDYKIIWAGCIDNLGRKIIPSLEILECQSQNKAFDHLAKSVA